MNPNWMESFQVSWPVAAKLQRYEMLCADGNVRDWSEYDFEDATY